MALPASLAQHFELNSKLLIWSFVRDSQKKKKKEKNLLTKLPSFAFPQAQRTHFSVSFQKTQRKTYFQLYLLHLFCLLTLRFKGDCHPADWKLRPSRRPSAWTTTTTKTLITADEKNPPLSPPPPPSLRNAENTEQQLKRRSPRQQREVCG